MTIPLLLRTQSTLSHLINKAEAFMVEKGMNEADILGARLAPDMFPFVKQIQIATDNAKGIAARLAGVENPVLEDNETTFAELRARISKVEAFLGTLTPEQFNDAGTREVRLKYFEGKHFIGHTYLIEYGIPNIFFHVTTAYGILRNLGVQIGKSDYLGHLSFIPDA